MLDYQRIVDDLRSSLSCYCAEGDDFLRAAAADYSVACDEVNERLHQCGALLSAACAAKPSRSPISSRACWTPWRCWISRKRRNGPGGQRLRHCLALAPAARYCRGLERGLCPGRAAGRDAAAAPGARLGARGSLPARIRVLRRLAELDADNAIWHEDLQVFEKERQTQIEAEAKTATHAGDAAALSSLKAEVSSPDWRNPPPEELVKSVADTQARLYYWSVQSQFEQLVAALEAARARFRADDGRTLRRALARAAGHVHAAAPGAHRCPRGRHVRLAGR